MASNSNSTSRIHIISGVLIAVSLLFIGRLFVLQILRGADYAKDGERQYSSTAASSFNRGKIYFTEKDGNKVSAATIKITYLVAINPKLVTDPEAAYKDLAAIIPLEREAFMAKAQKVEDPYEVITKGLEEGTADIIRSLKIPGVRLYEESSRYYPANERAAHTLGLVAQSKDDGDVYAGRYGLEKFYNDTLSRGSTELYTNFFADIFSDIGDKLTQEKIPEGNLVLSIEPTVQSTLEKELLGIVDKWKSDSVGAIVIEPSTGRLIAMASLPTFDPNAPGKQASSAVFSNPLVENVYEMGSIIKPLTVAAGLDEGVITEQTTYNDTGSRTLNGKKIQNFDGKARGVVPMQEILNQSLNTGVVFIMEKLGIKKFSEKMLSFGLGEKTGIDLPNEATGLAKNLQSTREIEHATASYGQGIAITPLETVRALSVLANGGLLIEPHVVDYIEYSLGSKTMYEPKNPPKQVLKKSTSDAISGMLQTVVDVALAHGKARLETHTIAAKTGTAQVSQENGGGYYPDRYLHSFFGYFPAHNPKFLVFFYSKYPKGAQYASETLTEPFMNMTKFLINYYQIPPDREAGPVLKP